MNNSIQERRQTIIFRLAFVSALLGLVVMFALVGLEIYVRWFIAKDFAFLNGFELSALIISVFALIVGMVYSYRSA